MIIDSEYGKLEMVHVLISVRITFLVKKLSDSVKTPFLNLDLYSHSHKTLSLLLIVGLCPFLTNYNLKNKFIVSF